MTKVLEIDYSTDHESKGNLPDIGKKMSINDHYSRKFQRELVQVTTED